jgi:hypothetical protein
MRIEYGFELSKVKVPRFSVEAVEGIGKLFTLATLVLNVIETQPKVEIVFHGVNANDPEAKLSAFKQIVSSAHSAPELTYDLGEGGQILNSSSYFLWVVISR